MSWRHLAVATEAVLRAGRIQKDRYASGVAVEYKGEIDLVTEVDRDCELAILETIRSRYPSHDIVTEETDLARTGSRHVWFIDPLDGTVNFAHSYPFFCASVALAVDGEIVAGAVFDPVAGRALLGREGRGRAPQRPAAQGDDRAPADREPASSRGSPTTCTRSSTSGCARSTG